MCRCSESEASQALQATRQSDQHDRLVHLHGRGEDCLHILRPNMHMALEVTQVKLEVKATSGG